MKFSVIVPAYNVEKYIKRCLDSIINQTYKNYEIIVVNDGCTDNTMDIAKNYDAKIINLEHVSVSEARNQGVKKASGDYILFLDSDDYWSNELLENISNNLSNNPDLVRFQIRTVNDNNEIIDYHEEEFSGLNGESAFNKIVNFKYVDSVCLFAIKKDYFLKEKFEFRKDTVHEDFGLAPLIIIKSNIVNSIDYIGYNYYKRSGSIMNNPDYDWIKKKVEDVHKHYKYLIEEIDKTNLDSKYFKSFVANSFIEKICSLNEEDYKKYKKILKEERVYDNILSDTFKRKVKKILLKISPKRYYKIKK